MVKISQINFRVFVVVFFCVRHEVHIYCVFTALILSAMKVCSKSERSSSADISSVMMV